MGFVLLVFIIGLAAVAAVENPSRIPPKKPMMSWPPFVSAQPEPGGLAEPPVIMPDPASELSAAAAALNKGVVAAYRGTIQLLTLTPWYSLSPYFLDGKLGNDSGGLLDAVVTSNGRKALISNYYDGRVVFIDISNPAAPAGLGWVNLPFFAEDLALTPDDKYVLVTDGVFESQIAVVDVAAKKLVKSYSFLQKEFQAVDISRDGRTVLTVDFWNAAVDHFQFDPATGVLTHKKRFWVLGKRDIPPDVIRPPGVNWDKWTCWPTNVTFSPDGKTALVSDGYADQILVFHIPYPGAVKFAEIIFPGRYYWAQQSGEIPYVGGQSVAFTRDGKKAYASLQILEDGVFRTEVAVLRVNGPGKVVSTGVKIPIVPTRYFGQFFGVDTMAIDPGNKFLFFTNPTPLWTTARINVINVAQDAAAGTLKISSPHFPPNYSMDFPTGIAFRR